VAQDFFAGRKAKRKTAGAMHYRQYPRLTMDRIASVRPVSNTQSHRKGIDTIPEVRGPFHLYFLDAACWAFELFALTRYRTTTSDIHENVDVAWATDADINPIFSLIVGDDFTSS
jgi:hypothetical protein